MTSAATDISASAQPVQALVIHGAKDLRVDERTVGSPGPGQVKLRIDTGGVCGSDLHYYHDGGFGPIRLKEPMVLGHEVCGRVSELGNGVTGVREGDLVAVNPSRPCGACRYCMDGWRNHCLNMRFYGSAMPFPHIQGAFCQELVADVVQCINADGLTPAQAATAEPLAVALHGMRRAGSLLGKRVLVTGCGPIGALSIMAARRAGAAEIVCTDVVAAPLEHGLAVGADRAINISADVELMAEYAADRGYFDVLVEASGAQSALELAIGVLAPRGIIVQLGIGGDMRLPMTQITAKELELRGSFRFHEEFALAVGLMQKGLLDVTPLVTHSLPLAQAGEAFDLASDRKRAMKVQITFG
jgi:L-idonate 5-dehydrogenase